MAPESWPGLLKSTYAPPSNAAPGEPQEPPARKRTFHRDLSWYLPYHTGGSGPAVLCGRYANRPTRKLPRERDASGSSGVEVAERALQNHLPARTRVPVVRLLGDLDLGVGHGADRRRHAYASAAARRRAEGAAADASPALPGVPHLVVPAPRWFGQPPSLQLDLEVVPDLLPSKLAAGLGRHGGGRQGQAIGGSRYRPEHPETQDRHNQERGGRRKPDLPPARRAVTCLAPRPRKYPFLQLRRWTGRRGLQHAVGPAHFDEVVPAGGATFEMALQFLLFLVCQLPQHVRTEELAEAVFTHRGPPSVRGLPWPA